MLKSLTKPIRRDIPHEADQWVELRILSAADLSQINALDGIDFLRAALERTISAWSYDAPISAETVGELDIQTLTWLEGVMTETSGLRSPEQKNGSSSSSLVGQEPAAAASPTS